MSKSLKATAQANEVINNFEPAMKLNPYAEGYTHDFLVVHPQLKASDHYRSVKSFFDYLHKYYIDINSGCIKAINSIGKQGLLTKKGALMSEIQTIELMFQNPTTNPPPKIKLRTFRDYFMLKMFRQMELMECEAELKNRENCGKYNDELMKEVEMLKKALKNEQQEHQKTKTSLKRALEENKEMKDKKAIAIKKWQERRDAQRAKTMSLASQIKFNLVNVEKYEATEEKKEEEVKEDNTMSNFERMRLLYSKK